MAGPSFRACFIVLVTLWMHAVNAHIAAWAPGMYCKWGRAGQHNINNDLPNAPLHGLLQRDWWFQHHRGCDRSPPPEGEFLELPAGGNFTVELAGNIAFTSLRTSPPPQLGLFGDGRNHRLPYDVANGAPRTVDGCIGSPNLHTKNESGAAGSAFAISYESDLANVTMDNLVVFSVRHHTPFYRLTRYDVPADLPPCPEEGCHCAWLWIADGCGQENMFMNGLKCKVTGSTSNRRISRPQSPKYCKDDPDSCVKGAKRMIAWQQRTGNNYNRKPGEDRPGYNANVGFFDGPQNDIFEDEAFEDEAADGTPTEDTQPTQTAIGSIAEPLMSMVPEGVEGVSTRKRRFLVFQ